MSILFFLPSHDVLFSFGALPTGQALHLPFSEISFEPQFIHVVRVALGTFPAGHGLHKLAVKISLGLQAIEKER